MPSQVFRLSQIIALAIALLGAYVVSGWVLGNEVMVRIVPNSVAMGLNTALLFIAAALCLWPASWPRVFSRLPTLCAWLLILLPCAILFEHWRDINLGIDWTALHAIVKDGNPRPGRTAPNTCIGFFHRSDSVIVETSITGKARCVRRVPRSGIDIEDVYFCLSFRSIPSADRHNVLAVAHHHTSMVGENR